MAIQQTAPALDGHKEGASQATSYRGPWSSHLYEAYVEEADAIGLGVIQKKWRRPESFYDRNFALFTRTVFEPREVKPFTRKK